MFFFNATATTEIYTLSLHDALPIWLIPKGRVTSYGAIAKSLGSGGSARMVGYAMANAPQAHPPIPAHRVVNSRSEEHTSELQSRLHLVCRLLLEKKKKYNKKQINV